MDIYEINDIYVNNNPIDSLNVNNTAISDELITSENNDKESLYAINKRIINKSDKITLFLTLSVSVLAGGSTIVNAFVGSDPVINNFANCFHLEGATLNYELDLTIFNSKLKMNIIKEEVILSELVFESSGIYKDSISLEEVGNYCVKFYSTNLFDYNRELSDYSFTFII